MIDLQGAYEIEDNVLGSLITDPRECGFLNSFAVLLRSITIFEVVLPQNTNRIESFKLPVARQSEHAPVLPKRMCLIVYCKYLHESVWNVESHRIHRTSEFRNCHVVHLEVNLYVCVLLKSIKHESTQSEKCLRQLNHARYSPCTLHVKYSMATFCFCFAALFFLLHFSYHPFIVQNTHLMTVFHCFGFFSFWSRCICIGICVHVIFSMNGGEYCSIRHR